MPSTMFEKQSFVQVIHLQFRFCILTILYIFKTFESFLESKELLRIQPAQMFHCIGSVIWCIQ